MCTANTDTATSPGGRRRHELPPPRSDIASNVAPRNGKISTVTDASFEGGSPIIDTFIATPPTPPPPPPPPPLSESPELNIDNRKQIHANRGGCTARSNSGIKTHPVVDKENSTLQVSDSKGASVNDDDKIEQIMLETGGPSLSGAPEKTEIGDSFHDDNSVADDSWLEIDEARDGIIDNDECKSSGNNENEPPARPIEAAKPSRDGKLSDLSTITPHLPCFVCNLTTECMCWDKRIRYDNIDSIYLGPLEMHVSMPDNTYNKTTKKKSRRARRVERRRTKKNGDKAWEFSPPTPEQCVHQSIHVAGEHNRLSACDKSTTLVMMGLGRDRQWLVDVPWLVDGEEGDDDGGGLPLLFDQVEHDLQDLLVEGETSNSDDSYANPFFLEDGDEYDGQPVPSQREVKQFSKAKKKHQYWLVLSQRSVGEMLQRRSFTDALFVYLSMIRQMVKLNRMHLATFGEPSKDMHIMASILFDMGNIYALNHEHEEALLFYEKAMDILAHSQHAGHIDALVIRTKCGMMRYASQELDGAEKDFRAVLDGLREGFASSSSLANIYNNLACVEFERSNTTAALMWWRKALTLGATSLLDFSDDDDRSTASIALSLSNLCIVYAKTGEPEESASAAEQALSLHQSYLGPYHFTLRASYSSLALAAKLANDYEVASSVYRELYESQKEAIGASHPGTLRTLELFSESIIMLPKSVHASILQKDKANHVRRRRRLKILRRSSSSITLLHELLLAASK